MTLEVLLRSPSSFECCFTANKSSIAMHHSEDVEMIEVVILASSLNRR